MKEIFIRLFFGFKLKTPKNFDELIYELFARTWTNKPKTKSKTAIGLHGRAWGDDEPALFDHVSNITHGSVFNIPVLVNGSDGQKKNGKIPGESWPGGKVFREELQERKVQDIRLFPCENPTPDYRADTTVEESEMMLDHAILNGLESIILVSWQHQMVRCLVSMVKAMKKSKRFINVYCECPQNCSWLRIVRGSQGMNKTERKNHAGLELIRLKFMLKSDPQLLRDTLKFLDNQEEGLPLWTGII